MQRTGAGPLTRQVLVVDGGLAEPTGTAARSVRALVTELRARNVDVLEAVSYEDGLATVVSDAGIHCILVDWTRSSDDSAAREQATELLARRPGAQRQSSDLPDGQPQARGLRQCRDRDAGR